jgi:hypothetical protein
VIIRDGTPKELKGKTLKLPYSPHSTPCRRGVSTPEQNRASRRRESAPFDWNWPD